jgi:aryl-alcohol dehydrogenase-like predicted oxidoreductase
VPAHNRSTIIDGLSDPELINAGEPLGVGIIPYTPLASGILTGKYKKGEEPKAGTRFADLPGIRERLTDEKLAKVEKVRTWAEERGHTASEAAVAWLLAHPVVSSVIVGARTAAQVKENVKIADWTISAEERDELSALVNG